MDTTVKLMRDGTALVVVASALLYLPLRWRPVGLLWLPILLVGALSPFVVVLGAVLTVFGG